MSVTELYSIEEINQSFPSDRLDKKPISVSYKIAILATTIVMTVLPLVYFGLIGTIVYMVINNWQTNITQAAPGDREYLFNIILSIFWLVIVLFMIKPIFARMPKSAKDVVIPQGKEPALEALIARICEQVNAPYPKEIAISHDVNASASLRKGIWSLFNKDDLRLTIGAPLLHGLSTQELSEVLAHEFGHFAQGAGMRFTYLSRSINFWFLRVVYQRDAFDVGLHKLSSEVRDIRLSVFIWAIQGCIWLTRTILKGLMWIGQAISCHTLRQMEFDADHHAARVVGSNVFEKTSRRMNELMIGQNLAFQTLEVMWMEKQLPISIPRLIEKETHHIDSEKFDEFLATKAKEEKTTLFDTHPSDTDRVKAVLSHKEDGIFHIEGNAKRLMSSLKEYSEDITKRFYTTECEFDLTKCKLIENDQMDKLSEARASRSKGMTKWFHDAIGLLCPIPLEAWSVSAFPTAEAALNKKYQLDQEIEQEKDTLQKNLDTLAVANSDVLRGKTALSCLQAGFQLQAGAFDMQNPSTFSAQSLISTGNANSKQLREQLAPTQIKLAQRLLIALSLKLMSHPELSDDVNTCITFVQKITNSLPPLYQLNEELTPLMQIIAAIEGQEVTQETMNHIDSSSTRIKAIMAKIWERMDGIIYPLNEDGKTMHELAFARGESSSHPIIDLANEANSVIDRTHQFYVDALSHMATIADQE